MILFHHSAKMLKGVFVHAAPTQKKRRSEDVGGRGRKIERLFAFYSSPHGKPNENEKGKANDPKGNSLLSVR